MNFHTMEFANGLCKLTLRSEIYQFAWEVPLSETSLYEISYIGPA